MLEFLVRSIVSVDIFLVDRTPGPKGVVSGNCCGYNVNPETVTHGMKVQRVKGVNTPNFRRLQREGALIKSTPWFKFDGEEGYGNYICGYLYYPSCAVDQAWPQRMGAYRLDDPEALITSILSEVDVPWNDLANRAIEGLNPSFDLGTFIAELRETVRMVLGMADRFRLLSEKAERLRKVMGNPYQRTIAMKRLPKRVVDSWLEWRYGWRILLIDLKNLHEVISEKASCWQSGSGSHEQEIEIDFSTPAEERTHGQWYEFYGEGSLLVSARVSARAKFDVAPPAFEIEGIKTAYEVIPYSFVLDWFWNFGEYLSALLYMSELDVNAEVTYSRSVKVEYSHSGGRRDWSTDWQSTNTNNCGTWRMAGSDRSHWQRFTAYQRWPSEESAKLPRFKVDLDLSHIADLVALLYQILARVMKIGR